MQITEFVDILTSFAWSATVADDDLGATSTTENNNELSCVIFKESTSLFRVKKKKKEKTNHWIFELGSEMSVAHPKKLCQVPLPQLKYLLKTLIDHL